MNLKYTVSELLALYLECKERLKNDGVYQAIGLSWDKSHLPEVEKTIDSLQRQLKAT